VFPYHARARTAPGGIGRSGSMSKVVPATLRSRARFFASVSDEGICSLVTGGEAKLHVLAFRRLIATERSFMMSARSFLYAGRRARLRAASRASCNMELSPMCSRSPPASSKAVTAS
jgi:hypothetical protein